MVTRGMVSVNASKQAAYDALLAACKDMSAEVKYASAKSFTVDGQYSTKWLQNRFSFRAYARIRDQHDGVVLDDYGFSPLKMDKKFLGKLFKKIEKNVSATEPAYADVQSIDSVLEQSAPPSPLVSDAVPKKPGEDPCMRPAHSRRRAFFQPVWFKI